MGSLSIWHLIILLIVILILALAVYGVYWLVRLAVKHGTRDNRS